MFKNNRWFTWVRIFCKMDESECCFKHWWYANSSVFILKGTITYLLFTLYSRKPTLFHYSKHLCTQSLGLPLAITIILQAMPTPCWSVNENEETDQSQFKPFSSLGWVDKFWNSQNILSSVKNRIFFSTYLLDIWQCTLLNCRSWSTKEMQLKSQELQRDDSLDTRI